MKRRQLIGMHRLLSRCVPVYVFVRLRVRVRVRVHVRVHVRVRVRVRARERERVRVRVREREREREHVHVRIFSPIIHVYYLYVCVYTCSFLVNEACLLCMSLVLYD